MNMKQHWKVPRRYWQKPVANILYMPAARLILGALNMATEKKAWLVNSSSFNAVLQVAEVLGGSRASLLASLDLPQQQLTVAEGGYPLESFVNLYEAARTCTDNEDIGLYAGRVNYINRLNIQLYVVKLCKTFRQFLNLMPSLLGIAGDIGEMGVVRSDNLICLKWAPLWKKSSEFRYFSDEILMTSAMIANSMCIRPIPVLRAEFSYQRPLDCTLLEEAFGKNLRFNCESSALYYDKACLDYPLTQMDGQWLPGPSETMLNFFPQQNKDSGFLQQVKQVVVRLMPSGKVSIERVAQDLNISTRTLQRRLLEKETQFQLLLKDVRSEVAVDYLMDARLSITDVAFLLGYNDHRSFSGAFKQWYKMSPRDYRLSNPSNN